VLTVTFLFVSRYMKDRIGAGSAVAFSP